MEKDLASHIRYLADMYYSLSLEKCKQLEYELAEKNNLVFRILDIRLKKQANSGGLASRKDTTSPSDLLKQHQLAVLRHFTNTQSNNILKKKGRRTHRWLCCSFSFWQIESVEIHRPSR